MMQLIGLMVAVVGIVVCAYVGVRAVESSQLPTTQKFTVTLFWIVFLLALLGALGIAGLGVMVLLFR